ncbi:hypothetical protein Ddye_011341 [Dipteronia dyeriana]|uniref:AAA+ ATPase domain-containing protein n=1 Tax=Dipteronia dyeriana TaxID=168575 RepID=A0AAD9X2D2_9ROSI|nr:hypothetical protein Ddye_011341 [Dipteronia dyeriana]
MDNACSFSASCDAFLSRFLDCTVRRASYICELRDNLASLKSELRNLIQARDDVIVKINLAERRLMKRTNQVQGWLQKLHLKLQVWEKGCTKSFKMWPRTSKTERRDFGDNVAERIPEDPVDRLPIEPTVIGQENIFDQVWGCLREEHEVGIIGLYGTGGVGKTTLLTQINNKFCDVLPHDFDVVIWTVVSKELELEKIQEDIGKRIGLCDEQWKKKTLRQKAQDISSILSHKKFVLLLDDIWNHVDLKEVGVPNPGPNTTSKIIFTTRLEAVCGQMHAHKRFREECLGHDEAWKLFQNNLHGVVLDSNPDILQLAKEVAEECGGLPLVIKTIARAMACTTTFEDWDYTIQILKRPPSEYAGTDSFPDMNGVYYRLKFSYDRLHGEKFISCFKYCCLFSEDCLISKRDLIDCWIGEGYLDEFEGRVVINQGYSIINTLVRACLLEENGNGYVKMHDVIRDMALWIARKVEKENGNFLVCASFGLTKAVKARKWEGVRRMSLMDNKIKNLPEAPQCSPLITLFLNGNWIRKIPHDFF